MISFLCIITAYLLGSIPFGYLVTRFSTGKNILEIGWQKTSTSNVFKNVGIWQGLLTGLLDLLKGFAAVWLAQKLGLSVQVQALCGAAAIAGHNWSCFLNFAGGRGIATLLGAFLALSPQILGYSIIPLVVLALTWNSAVGTILFLITAIILTICFGQFTTIGILPSAALILVLIKRLSPLKELSSTKGDVIRNRLIFDDDIPHLEFRLKKAFQSLIKR